MTRQGPRVPQVVDADAAPPSAAHIKTATCLRRQRRLRCAIVLVLPIRKYRAEQD
jgi:hypothetical protein